MLITYVQTGKCKWHTAWARMTGFLSSKNTTKSRKVLLMVLRQRMEKCGKQSIVPSAWWMWSFNLFSDNVSPLGNTPSHLAGMHFQACTGHWINCWQRSISTLEVLPLRFSQCPQANWRDHWTHRGLDWSLERGRPFDSTSRSQLDQVPKQKVPAEWVCFKACYYDVVASKWILHWYLQLR